MSMQTLRGKIARRLVEAALTVIAVMGCAPAMSNPFLRDIARPGNEAYQKKDFSIAAQEYLKAQDLEPLSAELRLNLGSAYFQQEEYEKAREEFTEASRADDPAIAASAYYNLGNARYKSSKKEYEAGMVAASTQTQQGNPTEAYVKKLEECIQDYQEALKRTPEDQDAKYNIEVIRREIKNLMRRQEQNPQQQQQQDQDKKDQKDQQQQEQDQQQNQDKQEQQQKEQQQKDQQNQDQKPEDKEKQSGQQDQPQGTPTPQPMAQAPTPSPDGKQGQDNADQQPTAEPTQALSISEEMAKNLLDNLPEQRPRNRPRQRQKSDKDW